MCADVWLLLRQLAHIHMCGVGGRGVCVCVCVCYGGGSVCDVGVGGTTLATMERRLVPVWIDTDRSTLMAAVSWGGGEGVGGSEPMAIHLKLQIDLNARSLRCV